MLFNYKEHRIFAFSDSHGMHKRLHIPEEADILLCAGDVVSGFGKDGMENFFSWLLSHPAKLYIFVAGNHELFLEDSLEQTISLLPKKVVFLHDSTFEFDGISFGNISMRSRPLLLEVYRSQPRFHVFGHAHFCGNQSKGGAFTEFYNVSQFNELKNQDGGQ